jgi:uncharacterized protein (TIGR00255 family)
MTGYGQSKFDDGQIQISVEVKSLNSKFLDLNLRLPKIFSEKELEVRNMVSDRLERGKVLLNIDYQRHGQVEPKHTYNEPLFINYYNELKKLAALVQTSDDKIFELALNSPDVVQSKLAEDVQEEEWLQLKKHIENAIKQCNGFREEEGKSLEQKFKEYCNSIKSSLGYIEEIDPKRVEKIRERLKGNVTSLLGEEGYDTNRLEQEIIFYVEKLDINEEKVRLSTHLEYFLKTLKEQHSNGKKLGFIAQELGREINTIGSKASDADIQKYVVLMKEELEKIKEQLNNIL